MADFADAYFYKFVYFSVETFDFCFRNSLGRQIKKCKILDIEDGTILILENAKKYCILEHPFHTKSPQTYAGEQLIFVGDPSQLCDSLHTYNLLDKKEAFISFPEGIIDSRIYYFEPFSFSKALGGVVQLRSGQLGEAPTEHLIEKKQWPLLTLCFQHFLEDPLLRKQYVKVIKHDFLKYLLNIPSNLINEFVKFGLEKVEGIKDSIIPISAKGNVKFVNS